MRRLRPGPRRRLGRRTAVLCILAAVLPGATAGADARAGAVTAFPGALVGEAATQEVDSLPRITLAEALRRAADVDPDYVSSLRRVGDAAWVRRAAWLAFFVPSLEFQYSFTRFSAPQFNPGIADLADRLSVGNLTARYPLFRGGAKFSDLSGAQASVEGAEAAELKQRFETALATEADYYDVIAQRELLRVARERVRRAEEQLGVARARVISGAAVQTDSLQLLLELTRARVERLRQESALKVARLQLGRRIGVARPVDAAPVDTLPAQALPISEAEAVKEAIEQSPSALAARAEARAAEAAFRSERGSYLPAIDLFAGWVGFDENLIPDATTRTSVGIALTLPLWNGGTREINLYRSATRRRVADAARRDAELAAGRDMMAAYEAFETARASTALAIRAVEVARENLRVQEERYSAGATTIIDLVTAQVDLASADAELVQARFAAWLALAGVEAILGRRLPAERDRNP